jgi:quinoprotein glucose dehydrogenase
MNLDRGRATSILGDPLARLSSYCITALLCVALTPLRVSGEPDGEWRVYGHDLSGTKYTPLAQIDSTNVEKLGIVWRWRSPDNEISAQFPDLMRWTHQVVPLMVGGVLYASSSFGVVTAIDASTGKTRWQYDPQSYLIGTPAQGIYIHRGVSYWSDGDDERIIYGTPDARLIALDAKTGKPVSTFGDSGRVDLTQGLRRPIRRDRYSVSSPPAIVGDVVVVGSSIRDAAPTRRMPPGDVRGFDARTGKQLWTFHTIAQPGEPGHETWEDESWRDVGNTNVWAVMTADLELGTVYLPVSTPTNDWYGGVRHGDNLFAESLVCLNAKTGERVWHFQAVHHGLWDYDFPASPNLVEIEVDGKKIRAVAQVSKQGFTYVFDRKTGEPVWPIEERSVRQSTLPGEKSSPTQPFPTKPAPFDRQGISKDDLIDFTPELRAEAEKILAGYSYGPLFDPPQLDNWLQLPGALGGANFGGAAFDPETGWLYVPSRNSWTVVHFYTPDQDGASLRWTHGGRGPQPQMPEGLRLFKPPYTRMTAIDMNTGEIAWVQPLGDGGALRDHEMLAGLDLPPLGGDRYSGPLVTPTLLIHGQSADPEFGGNRLVARDKRTGELVGSVLLPERTLGAPMTYSVDGPRGLPLLKPPYGRVTAIDLNTGEHAWMQPVGEGPRDHPALAGLDLPRLGWPQRSHPLLTKTLLFVGQEARTWDYFLSLTDGSQIEVKDTESLSRFHPKLYAYDKRTGELRAEIDVPANVSGAPMSYLVDGKQFIVFRLIEIIMFFGKFPLFARKV